MNFLFVGFALIIVNVNISLWVTYAVKALGFVMLTVGAFEYSVHDKGIKDHFGNAAAMAVMNGVFTAGLIYASLKLKGSYVNYVGIGCGVVSTILSLHIQKKFMDRILRSGEGKVVTDDDGHKRIMAFVADVRKLGRAWNKLSAAVLANLAADIANRLLTADTAVTVSGLIAVITKVICIVFALAFLFNFNSLRVGYEKTMERL